MLVSVAASLLVVPAATAPWIAIVMAVVGYSACISADSAALTSGIVDSAPP